MSTRKLDKSEWKSYFGFISRTLASRRAEVSVSAADLGSHITAEWVPILGIVYEPKSDVFEILLEGLDHLVHRPSEVQVSEGASGLEAVELIDAEDRRHIIRLREPLALPPAS